MKLSYYELIALAKERGLLWWSKSNREPGTSEVYATGFYAGYFEATNGVPNITDGFGQFWPSRCPDCGAEMQIERPGRATCSNECWITPAEGAAETPKGE